MKNLISGWKWLSLAGALSVTYILMKAAFSMLVNPAQLLKLLKVVDLKRIGEEYPDLSIQFASEKNSLDKDVVTLAVIQKKAAAATILVCNGQGVSVREDKKIRQFCRMASDTGYNVVGFDYAGTGGRWVTTMSSRDLVNDGLILAKKIAATGQCLIIKGNSLGGAASIFMTKICHDNGIKAYVWGGKTFQSIAAVMSGHVRTLNRSGHYETRTSRVLAGALKPLFSSLLYMTQFEMEVASAWLGIPEDYKNYFFIRSAKPEREIKKDDAMIPHCSSLESHPDIKSASRLLAHSADRDNPHHIAFYRARRKFFAKTNDDAHGLSDMEVYCRKAPDMTAYDLFCLFATRYVNSHQKQLATKKLAF